MIEGQLSMNGTTLKNTHMSCGPAGGAVSCSLLSSEGDVIAG